MTNTDLSDAVGTAYVYISSSDLIDARFIGYYGEMGFLNPKNDLAKGLKDPRFPDWAYDKYNFAFLNEVVPEFWKANTEFHGVWERLMREIVGGDSLIQVLKFDIVPKDNAHVVDWGHMERVRDEIYRLGNFIATEIDMARIREAFLRYLQSRVPISEYHGQHDLPEVIIKDPISLERTVEIGEFSIRNNTFFPPNLSFSFNILIIVSSVNAFLLMKKLR